MKLYCNVINNQIVSGPHPIPVAFDGQPDDILLERGWYKVERIVPETFLDRTEVMSPPILELFDTYVRATFVKRDKTVEELAAQDNAKWEEVRRYRNELLDKSDHITTPDRWGSLTEEKRNAWITYRQALRDVPQNNSDVWNVTIPTSPDYVPPELPKRPNTPE